MAKKVTLGGTVLPNPHPVSDEAVIEHGGVRHTPDSARNPNVAGSAGEVESIHPLTDVHILNPADANDGSENGEQDSFKMPPFANGVDSRKRKSY